MLGIRLPGNRFVGDHVLIKALFIGIESFRFRWLFLPAEVPFAKKGCAVSFLPEYLTQGDFIQGKEFLPVRLNKQAVRKTAPLPF